jgi:DNA-binding NtrC family response regulator
MMSPERVEEELFGSEADGAVRPGLLEHAHGGTLFLDEIADMPATTQAKILRVLTDQSYHRVGGQRPVKVDVRVLSATSRNLQDEISAGNFREDLFYRLNVIPVTLPSLRDRREDIPLLARHFVQKSCRGNNLPMKTLSQDTVRALMSYAWPGNIRQLENAIEHAVAMSGADLTIDAASLPEDLRAPGTASLVSNVTIPDEGINFTAVVSQLERELIQRVMEKTRGNKRQAARLLNLSRTTFIDKLQRLNLADESAAGTGAGAGSSWGDDAGPRQIEARNPAFA